MIWFILIGVISGIISGMGIGGGTVLIPALCIFFSMEQTVAQNINLIYFIPTSVIAICTHVKQGNIQKKIVPKLVLGGLLSAALGSYLAVTMNPDILRKVFAFFLLGMGIMEFLKREQEILITRDV